MATIQIRIDGTNIAGHVLYEQCRFTSEADGNVGTALVVIDNSDRSFDASELHAGMTLELFIDGAREWDGWVMGLTRGWPFQADDTSIPDETPRFWTINGLDRNLLFGKRVMFDTADPSNNKGFKIWPAGTNDNTAIMYAIDHYLDLSGDGLTYHIDQIASPSPWEEFTLGFVSAPMGMLFEDCSEMTGGVYWIDPDRGLYYKSDRIVTAPFILSDDPTGAQRGYRDVNAALDFTECATQAIVFGAGRGSADPVFAKYTNTDDRATYGLWQWSDLAVGAWKQETVDRRARTYVNGSPSHRRGHSDPVPVVSCTLFEPGIRVGMVVDFRLTIFDYQEDLPVRKSTITFPTPSEVKYELELTLKVDTPFGVPDPWWLRRRRGGGRTPFRERIPPEGPGSQNPGGGTDGSDLLIDHYEQSISVSATVVGPTTFATPAEYTLMPFPVPVAAGLGDVAIVSVRGTQGIVDDAPESIPLGWTVIDQTGLFTEGNSWSVITFYKLMSGSEEPIFKVGMGGDVHPTPEVVAHVSVWRNVTSIALGKAYNTSGGVTWSWGGSALLVGDSASGPGGWVTLLETDLLAEAGQPTPMRTETLYASSSPGTFGVNSSIVALETAPSSTFTTPGPEITGAPWAGGNDYHDTFSALSTNMVPVGSVVSPVSGAPRFRLRLFDSDRWLVPPALTGFYEGEPWEDAAVGELVPVEFDGYTYPWSGFSTRFWSGGVLNDAPDLLIKWRFGGTQAQMAIRTFQFYLGLNSIQDDLDPNNVWITGVYFDVAGSLGANIQMDMTPFWGAPQTWPGDYGDLIMPGEAYSDPSVIGSPVVVSASSGASVVHDGSTHVTITLPTGAEIDDHYLLHIYTSDELIALEDFIEPEGWSKFGAPVGNPWFERRVDGTEGGELSFTIPGETVTVVAVCMLLRGAYDEGPSNPGLWGTFNPGDTADPDPLPSESWAGQPALYITSVLTDGTAITGGPSGYTMAGEDDDSEILAPDPAQRRLRMDTKSGVAAAENASAYTTSGVIRSYAVVVRGSSFAGLRAGVWYNTRIKVAMPTYGYTWYPYGSGDSSLLGIGLPLAMMKTWPADESEPMTGTSSTFHYYFMNPDAPFPGIAGEVAATVDDGWDIALPMAWVKTYRAPGDFYADYDRNMLELFSLSTGYEVDAIWRYGGGVSTPIFTDVPIYDSTENTEAGTYITTYPYRPGTLQVWYQGVLLRSGIDYIESDPAAGEFRILGGRDISHYLLVEYTQDGTTPLPDGNGGTTGGRVYRPAPVLQYGWGTRLDGYNCTMASACMAMDRHTLGEISATAGSPRATPPNMRSFQDDQSGGTDLFDVATAWDRGWNKVFFSPGTHSWAEFADRIEEGRGAILQGTYGNLPASKRFSASFTGGHAIYINERFANGNFWGIDPLYRYPVIYTTSELQDYAIGLLSPGLVSAGFTRDTTA